MPFVVISISYLLFTVTDGAIRMIVLLHAYNLSFSAMQVAVMFTLYELAGVVTNLAAGLAGARWGIRCTLITGLCLQLVSYAMLFGWREGSLFGSPSLECSQGATIAYVTIAQMFGGIAKDLTKLGGKTVTKLVTPAEKHTSLFRLVALLTGWKNSLKGVGYFAGSALIGVNYELALAFMMGLVALALPFAIFGLDNSLGSSKKAVRLSDALVTRNTNLNWLSLARCFLFASRDFWFEVPLPFFLRAPSCVGLGSAPCAADVQCVAGAACSNGTLLQASYLGKCALDASAISPPVCVGLNPGGGCGGLGWDRIFVGAVLGGYIIVYGQCQSYTPQLVTGPLKQTPPNKLTEVLWNSVNCLPTCVLAAVAWYLSSASPVAAADSSSDFTGWLMAAIAAFAVVFAVNSSIHSFLVVHYAKEEKVATSVGFYYMSNAVGRLIGTLGSGVIYSYAGASAGELAGTDALRGLAACFVAGTISSVLSTAITVRIRDDDAGLRCGPCVCIKRRDSPDAVKAGDAAEPGAVVISRA